MQPDQAVDPEACELQLPVESIKAGLCSEFLVHIRDQDCKSVFVRDMKVCFGVTSVLPVHIG